MYYSMVMYNLSRVVLQVAAGHDLRAVTGPLVPLRPAFFPVVALATLTTPHHHSPKTIHCPIFHAAHPTTTRSEQPPGASKYSSLLVLPLACRRYSLRHTRRLPRLKESQHHDLLVPDRRACT